jgi:hypothetical protein
VALTCVTLIFPVLRKCCLRVCSLDHDENRQDLVHPRYFFHTRDPVSTFWTGFGKYIIIAFAYVTTALAAMQVALAVPAVGDNQSVIQFNSACKYFSYITLVLIAIQIPLVFMYVCIAAVVTIGGWLRRRDPSLVSTLTGLTNV